MKKRILDTNSDTPLDLEISSEVAAKSTATSAIKNSLAETEKSVTSPTGSQTRSFKIYFEVQWSSQKSILRFKGEIYFDSYLLKKSNDQTSMSRKKYKIWAKNLRFV